jgi:hypothetical protein
MVVISTAPAEAESGELELMAKISVVIEMFDAVLVRAVETVTESLKT